MAKSKALRNAKSASGYSFDPIDLVIVGVDVEPANEADKNLVEDDKGRLRIDSSMVKNIAHYGVKVPVIIRIVDDMPVVVDGRRRVLHARKANEMRAERGEDSLPVRCILERGGANTDAKLTAITTNTFRADHGPMAQARKCADLINAGVPEDEVALSFGFSKSTLGNRLKLLDLPKSVQRHVESGSLSFMSALELHDLEAEEAEAAAEELVAEGGSKKGQAKRAKSKKNKDGEEKPSRPSLTLLKKVLNTEAIAECSEETIRVLRWVTGDLKTPHTIDGLTDAVKEATAKKKAPPRAGEEA